MPRSCDSIFLLTPSSPNHLITHHHSGERNSSSGPWFQLVSQATSHAYRVLTGPLGVVTATDFSDMEARPICQFRLGYLHPFAVQARSLGSDSSLDLIEVFPHLFTCVQKAEGTCCFFSTDAFIPMDPAVSWHDCIRSCSILLPILGVG